MATVVSHYGIHWAPNGIAFLMQGRGGTNAVGLKEKPPFEVRLPTGKHCNHQIPLAIPVPHDVHWLYLQQLLDDPLVQAMLPIPKTDGGCYFIADEANEPYLVLLSKLSSPIYPCVVPVTTPTPEAIIQELQQTNVQPFSVTRLEAKHSSLIGQVAKSATYLPRKLVMCGQKDVVLPPVVMRIETKLDAFDMNDLVSLPWEGLGATIVRKFMRKESFRLTREQLQAQGKPLAASPRERPFREVS